jgi:AcrR family transcriptional regulator
VTATPQASTADGPLPRTTAARLPKPMRRVLLLGAAREVFVSQGYHAAAMDEIAERAGVSKPVLYQHFTNKRGLYLALLDESVDDLVGAVSAALESTTDNRQRVEATFRAFFDYIGGAGEAFRLIFESDLSNEPDVRDRLDLAMRKCGAMVSEFIRADAGVSNAEADMLGMALVGMAQVSARYWLRTMRPLPQDTAENLLSRLSWRGISGWPLADGQHDQQALPVLPD